MSNRRVTHKERTKSNFLKTRETERISVREPLLIVCEDSKSSVFYFTEKRDHLRLEATKVKVTGESGSHPGSVVEFARNEREKNKARCKKTGEVPYSKIYCVFDVDEHLNLADAINRANALRLIPVVSNQSFELWFLLHFLETPPAWMLRDEINRQLSANMRKEYSKGAKGIYALIKDKEANAIKLAEQLLKDANELSEERNPYRNPSTQVHILIKKLNELAGK
jgi:hypothetical protein